MDKVRMYSADEKNGIYVIVARHCDMMCLLGEELLSFNDVV